MRFLSLFLLCLLSAPVVPGQTKPVWRLKGEFGFQSGDERIMLYKYLEHENRLLALAHQSLLLLDVGNAKVLESRPSGLPLLAVSDDCDFNDWVFSPDGRKILIIEETKAKDGAKQKASIWDWQTGKQITVLDKSPHQIRDGSWSKNGKTLVTYDYDFNFWVNSTKKLGVSFWDGETFEYRHSISVDFPTWAHLSDDGRRFFAASGRRKSFLGLKYISDSRGVINVWDTSSGEIEKTISVSDPDFNIRTLKISVSPDGRFLIFVNKHKSKSTEHRLLAWEMDGSISPKYEFKANPKIDDAYVRFSPDGKYFALDAGKTLQIYETRTGVKRFELPDVEPPDFWLNDNHTLIDDDWKKMEAFDATNGRKLYEQKLIHHTYDRPIGIGTTDLNGNIHYDTETVILDTTRLVAHPNGKIFLTYSNQYVKVFDSRTGELLQTIISPDLAAPTPDFCKKYPKQCKGKLVWKAGWSSDGKMLYVFNANRQTISLWELLEN
jgi:dipeptidyl aminopeptidase/acylaminoacyl peptidase